MVLEKKEVLGKGRNGAGPHKEVGQVVADTVVLLPTAYVLNAAMLFHVSPVFPAFSRNVPNVVLSWPVNF